MQRKSLLYNILSSTAEGVRFSDVNPIIVRNISFIYPCIAPSSVPHTNSGQHKRLLHTKLFMTELGAGRNSRLATMPNID